MSQEKKISGSQLIEATRSELLTKSKNSEKGRQRFDRRNKSSIARSVSQYNNVDMNSFFKDDILTINIEVRGETNNYSVRIKFGGVLEKIKDQLEKSQKEIDLKVIIKALIESFNTEDVYIGCSCEDFYYRFSYVDTKNKYSSLPPQLIPAPIRNPHDTLGSGCKHILLVLNNTTWIMKLASTIMNYINYMKDHYQKAYADIIYPAVYGKKYEEPVQLTFDDSDELKTDTTDIDVSNKYAKEKGKFKKGNISGIRFEPEEDKNQLKI